MDNQFFTATMARVYTGQGYYGKAAEIYRHLLAQAPERQDLAQALAEVEKAARANRRSDHYRLVALFTQWLDLAAGCRRIDRLQRLLNSRNAP